MIPRRDFSGTTCASVEYLLLVDLLGKVFRHVLYFEAQHLWLMATSGIKQKRYKE